MIIIQRDVGLGESTERAEEGIKLLKRNLFKKSKQEVQSWRQWTRDGSLTLFLPPSNKTILCHRVRSYIGTVFTCGFCCIYSPLPVLSMCDSWSRGNTKLYWFCLGFSTGVLLPHIAIQYTHTDKYQSERAQNIWTVHFAQLPQERKS